MSKSNGFLPGANERLNGTYVHSTCDREYPSCLATAYATADSKPLPVDGSLIFHFDPFTSPPPNHGGYAGLSVPIVSFPSLTVSSAAGAQSRGVVVEAPCAAVAAT